MIKFDDYLKEQLKDPGFRVEYEALQPSYEIMLAIDRAKVDRNLTD